MGEDVKIPPSTQTIQSDFVSEEYEADPAVAEGAASEAIFSEAIFVDLDDWTPPAAQDPAETISAVSSGLEEATDYIYSGSEDGNDLGSLENSSQVEWRLGENDLPILEDD